MYLRRQRQLRNYILSPWCHLLCGDRSHLATLMDHHLRMVHKPGFHLNNTYLQFSHGSPEAPFIERVRLTTFCGNEEEMHAKRAHFSWLAEANFKFMNYAERSLLPGERVVQTIYQPEIRPELLRLRGLALARSISPAHLCILTDSELIFLTDDDSQKWLRGNPHGAIWRYIPLTKTDLTSLTVRGESLLFLCILLRGNLQLESLFEASKREELERLQQQLNS